MNLRTFTTAAEFRDLIGPTLLPHEAENSLLLGVALRVLGGHSYGEEAPFFACVEKGGRLPLIALRTPPYNLLLCTDGPARDALHLIAQHLADRRTALPGAHGRVDAVDAFAELWKAETGVTGRVAMEQRLYQLTQVARPMDVPGRGRWATLDDLDVLTPWAEAFLDEAVPDDPKHDARGMLERTIAARGLLVWEDGALVSMCGRSRPTPHGESISLVYTPPTLRGRGYASACVAELSQRVLDSGKSFCTLYADLANPTSNAIYQRIGYRPLCDFREIRFSVPAEHT
jgi:predicted GNAT family acetyltransferase